MTRGFLLFCGTILLMATAAPASSDEFCVRQPLSVPFFFTLFILLLAFFVTMAILNLLRFKELALFPVLGSLGFLVLLGIILFGLQCEYGLGASLRNIMSLYARHQLIWIDRNGEETLLCTGFRFLGKRISLFRVELRGVKSVSWSAGQASSIASKDFDDWQVFIHFERAAARSRLPRQFAHDKLDLVGIGPICASAVAATMGKSLIEFLRAAGGNIADPQVKTTTS